jgi:alpha-amylase/alpha-mannosidase (GH57 family)
MKSGKMNYLSIHAHFYQPPRENPFTGLIPQEVGAEPFHDWNERITFECYDPMAQLGNFDRMSFNIGPTLAAWLEQAYPVTYERILEADRLNLARNGVGNAIAQVYNHTILPLANRRDKLTQVRWGLADFRARFGREAAAMFLAECTVDLATLEALADCGLKFVILAEWQAAGRRVDITQPYLVRLPNGKSITAFFFNGALAWNLHNDQLGDPENFARYSLPLAIDRPKNSRKEDQFVLAASDGEYYGHHYKGRAHWLSQLLHTEAPKYGWQISYPGLYLRDHPPQEEILIAERTAWSCFHGLNRWEGRCQCEPLDFVAPTSPWKGPFRLALDNLAAELDCVYEEATAGLLADPWATRDRYSQVILRQLSPAEFTRREVGGVEASGTALLKVERLLEAQFMRQWMYTSCGFFFEDLSRIEPKNNIAYAARAIKYVKDATGQDLGPAFLRGLAGAVSWRTGQTGSQLYHQIMSQSV